MVDGEASLCCCEGNTELDCSTSIPTPLPLSSPLEKDAAATSLPLVSTLEGVTSVVLLLLVSSLEEGNDDVLLIVVPLLVGGNLDRLVISAMLVGGAESLSHCQFVLCISASLSLFSLPLGITLFSLFLSDLRSCFS